MYVAGSDLLAQAKEGNEAFLGIGVLGWIIIIAIVVVVAYLLSIGAGAGDGFSSSDKQRHAPTRSMPLRRRAPGHSDLGQPFHSSSKAVAMPRRRYGRQAHAFRGGFS